MHLPSYAYSVGRVRRLRSQHGAMVCVLIAYFFSLVTPRDSPCASAKPSPHSLKKGWQNSDAAQDGLSQHIPFTHSIDAGKISLVIGLSGEGSLRSTRQYNLPHLLLNPPPVDGDVTQTSTVGEDHTPLQPHGRRPLCLAKITTK